MLKAIISISFLVLFGALFSLIVSINWQNTNNPKLEPLNNLFVSICFVFGSIATLLFTFFELKKRKEEEIKEIKVREDIRQAVEEFLTQINNQNQCLNSSIISLKNTLEEAVLRFKTDTKNGNTEDILSDIKNGKIDHVIEILIKHENIKSKKKQTDTISKSRFEHYLGVLQLFNNPINSLDHFERAIKLNPDNLGILEDYGVVLLFLGRPTDAINIFSIIIEKAKKSSQKFYLARSLTNLGELYRITGEFDKAITVLEKAQLIHRVIKDYEGLAANLSNLGEIYWNIKQYKKSEDTFFEAINLEIKNKNRLGLSSDYGNLGVLYLTHGSINNSHQALVKSEKYLQQAIEIDTELSNIIGLCNHLGNLGMVYSNMSDISKERIENHGESLRDKAMEFVLKALEYAQQCKYIEGEANQYSNLGVLFEDRGKDKEALDAWNEARNIYKKIGMRHMEVRMTEWIATLKIKNNY